MPIQLPDPLVREWSGAQRNFNRLAIEAEKTTAAARVYRTTNQSIASGGTGTVISFSNAQYDWGGLWNGTTKLVARIAGVYQASANIAFAAGSGAGQLSLQLRLNGASNIGTQNRAPGGPDDWLNLSVPYALVENDYIEVVAYQDAGAPVNVLASAGTSPQFGLTWVAPIPPG